MPSDGTGLAAMRALAHPTRVRMAMLLRKESLSPSDLARRLGIRFGSARFHLGKLVDAGIAAPAGEEVRRGGRARLFAVPHDLRVDLDHRAPAELSVALLRGYVDELGRRADAAALEQRPGDTNHDAHVLREIDVRERDRAIAGRIVDDALQQLLALDARGTVDAEPLTVGMFAFRTPRHASDRPHPEPDPDSDPRPAR